MSLDVARINQVLYNVEAQLTRKIDELKMPTQSLDNALQQIRPFFQRLRDDIQESTQTNSDGFDKLDLVRDDLANLGDKLDQIIVLLTPPNP